jgi:hypothetical protein
MTVLAKASSNLPEIKLEECTLVRSPEDKSLFWIDGRVILKITVQEIGHGLNSFTKCHWRALVNKESVKKSSNSTKSWGISRLAQ